MFSTFLCILSSQCDVPFLFPHAVLDPASNQKKSFSLSLRSRCNWVCNSHRFWMIKIGSNFFVVLRCSMLISGSSQLKKGMLSLAVYVELCCVRLAQAYSQFHCQSRLALKTVQNCTAIFWLQYFIQDPHSFCCIC